MRASLTDALSARMKRRRRPELELDVADADADAGSRSARRDASPASTSAPTTTQAPRTGLISVLMPCRSATPWLSACVLSVLTQRDVDLELVVADDGSRDDSFAWLCAVRDALGRAREGGTGGAREADAREAEGVEAFSSDVLGHAASTMRTYDAEYVARCASATCTLVVLRVEREGTPSGQGLALNACYAVARGEYVGEMESDDLRPPHAFATLKRALEDNPSWDASCSRIALCGMERQGMRRFETWQNEQLSPLEMSAGRFIEIPALRASGLYRRRALERMRALDDGCLYRDLWLIGDVVVDCAASAAGEPALASARHQWWPVDSDFWHRWFFHGFVVGKVPHKLYVWRQYEAQSTRTHSRCSLEQLRRCKAHYFIRDVLRAGETSPTLAVARIRVYGVGTTLHAWVAAIHDELKHQQSSSLSSTPAVVVPEVTSTVHTPGDAPWTLEDADIRVLHVFVFGMPKPRRKIIHALTRVFKAQATPTSPFGDFKAVFVA